MKNILKKLHIVPNESDDIPNPRLEGSSSSSKGGSSRSRTSSPARRSFQMLAEQMPLSGFSNWLNSVTSKNAGSSNSSPVNAESTSSPRPPSPLEIDREKTGDISRSYHYLGPGLDHELHARDLDMNESCDIDVEAYQIQVALELSAKEDPEAVQIEAVKQISLGSCPLENTPAEVMAYRYWNYNVLGYDDKILDGFYDLYGIFSESSSRKMPSLIDLQEVPNSEAVSWEAILVNRPSDTELSNLENRALLLAVQSNSVSKEYEDSTLIRSLAILVADYMGGAVRDPEVISIEWRDLSDRLRTSFGNMILPLGQLTTGLGRHRALMFKVLADSVGVPCQLMKGHLYTGSDDGAVNIVKLNNGREYIVDLMADPGTLIPSDSGALERKSTATSEIESIIMVAKSEENPKSKSLHGKFLDRPLSNLKAPARKSSHGFSLARSPSWTEGISSPAARRMKAKDVSQYVIDAAKENPKLAQKLHDVLLESGVVAPPNLFAEICHEHPDSTVSDDIGLADKRKTCKKSNQADDTNSPLRPHKVYSRSHHLETVEGLGVSRPLEISAASSSQYETLVELQNSPAMFMKNMPVAAAAATAAVVASSMIVAAAKSTAENHLDVPAAAAATATAAVVAATTAAVSMQYEYSDPTRNEPILGEDGAQHANEVYHETERNSDRSTGNESTRSDVALDDVGEFEISWEDLTVGERIGLGSYGEVFHGELHGTEVAVKKFLQQDLSGDALEEFRTEVQIMKRLRHPNVVLFMGAVTRVPNLSIITEFLPRGSLYRLIHRPNNQLDERKCLKMALDIARGMNYLHNCSPTIVHGDLKSPNLLVDKNWVVKVCDFGLSRMKHSTFLSSRSMAGTAEWMAPEVLRNEPSDEKCDVYSFGVIMWELCTLQQPWGGMNPMQVVGAVGFQRRQLDIPPDLNPAVADIIISCWKTDPKLRPSFSEIMAALRPLQKRPLIRCGGPLPKTHSHSAH